VVRALACPRALGNEPISLPGIGCLEAVGQRATGSRGKLFGCQYHRHAHPCLHPVLSVGHGFPERVLDHLLKRRIIGFSLLLGIIAGELLLKSVQNRIQKGRTLIVRKKGRAFVRGAIFDQIANGLARHL
jgi:hypothetical protein